MLINAISMASVWKSRLAFVTHVGIAAQMILNFVLPLLGSATDIQISKSEREDKDGIALCTVY